MSKKSPKTKKTTALVVKKERTVQDLVNMFAGSASLVQNDKQVERNLILRVAEAFAIPAVCVNIMGGLPYVNKDGLLFKLNEYEGEQILSLTTKMVEYAVAKGSKAIAEANLTFKDGRSFNAVGEADENSVKLPAVKMTPNMMAETRAQNRVIRRVIQARMIGDLYTKLGDKHSSYDDNEKQVIMNSVQSSAEEMTGKAALEGTVVEPVKTPAQEAVVSMAQAVKMAFDKIGQENDEAKLKEYREKLINWKALTDNQRKMLLGAIDQKLSKYAGK
jgi:hypothetical protein